MAQPQRLWFQLDLGPEADLQTVAAVMSDLATVADFAGAVQQTADRNTAFYQVLRRPNRELDFDEDWWTGGNATVRTYLPDQKQQP